MFYSMRSDELCRVERVSPKFWLLWGKVAEQEEVESHSGTAASCKVAKRNVQALD